MTIFPSQTSINPFWVSDLILSAQAAFIGRKKQIYPSKELAEPKFSVLNLANFHSEVLNFII
jgi:hypothetical protein